MTVGEICALITTIVGVLPTVISVVLLIRNIVANKDWKLVMQIADAAMSVVEEYSRQHPDMTSDQKLDMAIDTIKASLKAANIKYDDALLDRIKGYIKESVEWFNGMSGK